MDYRQSVADLLKVLQDMGPAAEKVFMETAAALTRCVEAGGKILIFGNGGSAAQAQHFAAELVNRFLRDRRPLPAVALNTDCSILTSVGNDVGFESVFKRQVIALGNKGDAAVGLSTSGSSTNVVEGLAAARSCGMLTVALTGSGNGRLQEAGAVDYLISVPSISVPRVQEAHLLLLHLLADEIESTC